MSANANTSEQGSVQIQLPWGELTFNPVPAEVATTAAVTGPTDSEFATTITVTDGATDAPAPAASPQAWRAILGFEGYPTDGDSGRKRLLMRGGISTRPLPQSLMLQRKTAEGHMGSEPAGRIDTVNWVPASDFALDGFDLPPDLPSDAMVIVGEGVFDSGEVGQEAARLVDEKTMRGVSLDLAGAVWVPLDPETFKELNPEDLSIEDLLLGKFIAGAKEAVIGGATIVATPAFGYALMDMAAAGADAGYTQIRLVDDAEPLVACAAGPLAPSRSWFEKPRLRKLTPLTVDEEGRITGHLISWDCHMGYQDRCMMPPRSHDGYARFHSGSLVTAEGERIKVGRITVKPHADRHMSVDQVIAHYSDARRVAAFVCIYDDEFGIAIAGATRSDAAPELLRDFYANPPSPDWRRGELLGISSVSLPGLPVAVPEAYLVASANGEESEVEMLLLPALAPEDIEIGDDVLVAAAALEGDGALLDMLVGDSQYLDDFDGLGEFAPTAAQRQEWARRGIAMPDGSFPITKCTGAGTSAINARRSIGRAPEGKRPAVRAHIAKRERQLNCSND